MVNQPPVTSDWECFLLPVSLLEGMRHLPMHEHCRKQLDHLVVPAARRTEETIHQELTNRKVCAVSWRWSNSLPISSTADLKDWSPMSELQLRRLKEFLARSEFKYVWIDWCCVPQQSADTMKFINASFDIYSQAPKVIFLPRIKELKRRGWPQLSRRAANDVITMVRGAANGVLTSGTFSTDLNRILKHSGRANLLERQLPALRSRINETREQLETVLEMLFRLLVGEDLVYSTFDYYARAWTLAERLAAFKPSAETPIHLNELQTAGDALLYGMASFWRDVQRHAGAYVQTGRPSWNVSDLSLALYLRGVDPSEEGVTEAWDDMNHMVQLAPGALGITSETSALALICVEWLLHEKTGVSDDLGKFAAAFLGECAAYTSLAVAGASMQEQANPEWFRQYLYFQAGSVYNSTVTQDLILAVYRSCGLKEQGTAEEAIESCLREVFGESAGSSEDDSLPDIDRLCREAIRHKDLHTYLLTNGGDTRSLSASDFAPMLPRLKQLGPVTVADWQEWLSQSGVVVSWWFSQLDNAMPVDPTEYIDVEHLYCQDVSRLASLSLEEVFRSAVTVVYKLCRVDDRRWLLAHLSFSRQSGRCGEGLSPFRNRNGLALEKLLRPDIVRGGRAQPELISTWNQRCLESLDEAVHNHWLQCISSTDITVIS